MISSDRLADVDRELAALGKGDGDVDAVLARAREARGRALGEVDRELAALEAEAGDTAALLAGVRERAGSAPREADSRAAAAPSRAPGKRGKKGRAAPPPPEGERPAAALHAGEAPVEAPAEAKPPEAGPLDGEPFEGEPFAREPLEGAPFEGEPFEGEPFEGEPFEGEPFAREPFAREPFEGEPFAREPLEGEPLEGEPLEDRAAEEAPALGLGEVIFGGADLTSGATADDPDASTDGGLLDAAALFGGAAEASPAQEGTSDLSDLFYAEALQRALDEDDERLAQEAEHGDAPLAGALAELAEDPGLEAAVAPGGLADALEGEGSNHLPFDDDSESEPPDATHVYGMEVAFPPDEELLGAEPDGARPGDLFGPPPGADLGDLADDLLDAEIPALDAAPRPASQPFVPDPFGPAGDVAGADAGADLDIVIDDDMLLVEDDLLVETGISEELEQAEPTEMVAAADPYSEPPPGEEGASRDGDDEDDPETRGFFKKLFGKK